ncbi:hypothetical protein Tco_1255332 [Tanacetum coccineum]
MSTENSVNPPAPNLAHNSNFSLLSVLGRERLTGPNYMDWMRNLRFTLRYKNKEYVLDEQIPTINYDSTQLEIEAHQKHYDDANKVSCIMESSMSCDNHDLSSIQKVSKRSREPTGQKDKEDKITDSTLSELDKPANYNEAMASPEAAKWKEHDNAIQSSK